MSGQNTIRAGIAADLPRAMAWLQAAGLPVEDLTAAHMGSFLVLDRGADAVGMIGLERFADVGLLRSLVVAESARNAGAGRVLVTALEEHAREQGISELWLLTIDADRWFARCGYVARKRVDAPEAIRGTREFADLCPGDAILMSKPL